MQSAVPPSLPICDALRNLVPFALSKKRWKHPWRSVIFSKNAGLLKVTLFHACFSRFSICTNATKSRKAIHMSFSEQKTHFSCHVLVILWHLEPAHRENKFRKIRFYALKVKNFSIKRKKNIFQEILRNISKK